MAITNNDDKISQRVVELKEEFHFTEHTNCFSIIDLDDHPMFDFLLTKIAMLELTIEEARK